MVAQCSMSKTSKLYIFGKGLFPLNSQTLEEAVRDYKNLNFCKNFSPENTK